MKPCPYCGGQRVVPGMLLGEGCAVFRPDSIRFLNLSMWGGASIAQSFACRDCGLVWGTVDPNELERFLRKYCTGYDKGPTA